MTSNCLKAWESSLNITCDSSCQNKATFWKVPLTGVMTPKSWAQAVRVHNHTYSSDDIKSFMYKSIKQGYSTIWGIHTNDSFV